MLTADFQILDIKPGDRVLDVGCGTGRHACEIFRTLGADVVGVDLRMEDLRKAALTLYLMDGDNEWFMDNIKGRRHKAAISGRLF